MKTLFAAALLAVPAVAAAQSLFSQPPAPQPANLGGHAPDAAASLYGVSMFAVQPPKPRQYKVHDLVTIIVEETSKQTAQQSLKTDKKDDLSASLNAVIDPMQLLELRLRAAGLSNLALIDSTYSHKFDGKGSFERNDKFSMRIQAEVIDLKPNGVVVLEARKTIDKNGEEQSTVLSGNCRLEDISTSNTVLSTQLANLTIISRNEGQVNEAGKKGWIPRVLDTVFNF